MRKSLVHRSVLHPSIQLVVVALLSGFGTSAWSNCACFCVEGELKTLCTDVSEAQNRVNLCPAASSASCPQNFSTEGSNAYEPPSDSAQDCRDMQVYDAIRGEYVTAKACSVI